MAEIKRCPFCGEDGAESGESSVPAIGGGKKTAIYCNCCFCEGPPRLTEDEAVEAWNRRTSIGDTPAPQSTEGGEGRQELPDPECLKREPVCRHCGNEPPDCTCGVRVGGEAQGENRG